VTEALAGSPAVAGLAAAGRALAERCGAQASPVSNAAADLPVTGSPREWVERLAAVLPAESAAAVIEHLFGVLPLATAFFGPERQLAAVVAGQRLAALALFTPDPQLRWGAAAVAAESADGGLHLRGSARLPSRAASGALVLVRVGEERRLAWLDHDQPGVELRGDAPCQLAIAGAAVGAEGVSRPVTLAAGGELWTHLARYAILWALAAVHWARGGVQALRRAARAPQEGETRWSASQLVAMGIAEVEIETELAAMAVRTHFSPAVGEPAATAGLAIAVGAARALAAVATRTVELRDRLGLVAGGPLAGGLPGPLAAALGGVLMLESELAAQLGVDDLEPANTAR
jgi:hypothetical protein